jgi:hypothetical protein
MLGLLKRSLPLLTAAAAVAALAVVPPPAAACPFCTMQGQTLIGEVGQASMVLYGTFTNADEKSETTDLVIEEVIKDHAIRNKRKTLRLNKYVPPLEGKPLKYLVFCDIFKEKIDPYRGVPVSANSSLPRYLKKALLIKDKPIAQRLRFFFDYLEDPDLEVSNDAYKEFGNADYKDYQGMAKDLPAERLAKWLDPESPTAPFRYGLYASMLGHCGKPKDAAVLLKLLEDKEKRVSSGIDGILAGYTMLNPKEGWKYLQGTLKDTKKEFMLRYAALRAVRFLHDMRSDLVGKKELVEGVCQLLDQEDIADLAIEDLRKWQYWDKIDRVLAVRKGAAYKLPIVQRAVLRFCLSCPGNAKAAAYVAERRKEDADAVKEAQELLELEQEPAKPAKPAK